jgi:HAD superfamily hydrolase (TIGR01549 family)
MRRTVFLLDLDGTLVDSVYQHVLAWQEALDDCGIDLSVWRIHRRMGMSGGLFLGALLRETGKPVDAELVARLQRVHAEAYRRRATELRLLPGARELLARLTQLKVPWAIATSGLIEAARPTLALLEVPDDVPVVTRDQVAHAKPDPDLFLAAAERLDADVADAVVVGDSVWDLLAARRARALGIGLLSGGYGREELERAGAYRVYEDPADLLLHLDEVGYGTPRTPERLGDPYPGARTVAGSGPSREGGSLARRADRGGADRVEAMACHPCRHRARRAGGGAVRHQCVQQLRQDT